MRKQYILLGVLAITLLAGLFGYAGLHTYAGDLKKGIVLGPLTAEGKLNPAGVSLSFDNLIHKSWLKADGSVWMLVSAVVRNYGSTPYTTPEWCFFFGGNPSDYTGIFGEEAGKILPTQTTWRSASWNRPAGVCVSTKFTRAINNGQEYWYAIGINIKDAFDINNGIVDASWYVRSSSTPVLAYKEYALWPHNRVAVTAAPVPEEFYWNAAVWRRSWEDAPWELTVNVTVDTGTWLSVDPLLQGIWPYTDGNPAWETDILGFGDATTTIGSDGCYLTCMTMAMNYYAKVMQVGVSYDPGQFNAQAKQLQLEEELISFSEANFVGLAMQELSKELLGTPVIQTGEFLDERLSTADIKVRLRSGALVLLGVKNGEWDHYVLAIGVSDTGDIMILDPLGPQAAPKPLSVAYPAGYISSRTFHIYNGDEPQSQFEVRAKCPIELLVTDSQGRRTGFDPRIGIYYNEIPEADYALEPNIAGGEPIKVFSAKNYNSESYTVAVIGTGSGAYELTYLTFTETGNGSEVFEGVITKGEVQTVGINYDPNLGVTFRTFLPFISK